MNQLQPNQVEDTRVPVQRNFIREAVFSDGTQQFRSPMEPMANESVVIRLRTAHANIKEALLVSGVRKYEMYLSKTKGHFDYYEVELVLSEEKFYYYFELQSYEGVYYYTSIGISDALNLSYQFFIMPGFKTPDWAKGAVFYQIFVDRFYNGDSSNDVLDYEYQYIHGGTVEVKDWFKLPGTTDIRDFYGGDLLGVMKKLDYLKELGVEVLYLNPIFVSPSNHKYDIQDYDYVDPHYGVIMEDGGACLNDSSTSNKEATRYIKRVTSRVNLEKSNELFCLFVQEAHKRNIKVVLDGVFNHCGSFNKWLDREGIYEQASGYEKGAYISKDSPYHSFFLFRRDHWPYNDSYDGWWGHDTLPKLNYEQSEKLKDYIISIAKKWVSPPFCVDGWRLDVAADLGYSEEYNHEFWKEFRSEVKKANPEALIVAEHYGDASAWLQGDQWDSVMNYDAFMEPVTWFLTGVEKHSDQYRQDLYCNYEHFQRNMLHFMSRFQTPSLQVAMNELSNHDHSRFLTRTNHKVGRLNTVGSQAAGENLNMGIMREAVVIQMTWPGAPAIYYGDEAGVCGWTDPDNRRTYPWGREDNNLIAMHRELIKMHKSYQALKTGSVKLLYGSTGFLSYTRFDDQDQFIIALNNNSFETTVDLPVWESGLKEDAPLVQMFRTDLSGFGVEAIMYYPEKGTLRLKLNAYSSIVLKNLPNNFL